MFPNSEYDDQVDGLSRAFDGAGVRVSAIFSPPQSPYTPLVLM